MTRDHFRTLLASIFTADVRAFAGGAYSWAMKLSNQHAHHDAHEASLHAMASQQAGKIARQVNAANIRPLVYLA